MLDFNDIMTQVEAGIDPESIGKSILDSMSESTEKGRETYQTAGDGQMTSRNSQITSGDFELVPDVPIWDETFSQQRMTEVTGQLRSAQFREKKAEVMESLARGDKRFASVALTQAETTVIEGRTANQGLLLNHVIEQGRLIQANTNLTIADRGVVEGRTTIKLQQAKEEAVKGEQFLRGIAVEAQALSAQNDQKLSIAQEKFNALKGAGNFGSYTM